MTRHNIKELDEATDAVQPLDNVIDFKIKKFERDFKQVFGSDPQHAAVIDAALGRWPAAQKPNDEKTEPWIADEGSSDGGNDEPPIAKSGGGGDNGDMEARIARLESDMNHISKTLDEVKTDVREIRKDIQEVRKEAGRDYRTLFGALIAVALGLAGLMSKGFHWL